MQAVRRVCGCLPREEVVRAVNCLRSCTTAPAGCLRSPETSQPCTSRGRGGCPLPTEGRLVAVQTLSRRQVYDNPWMSIREDMVQREDGSTGVYAVVDAPDIAVVIPRDGDRFHLVEQYRYPVAGRRWEFPSGSAEEDLDLDAAALARRELREETGLLADTLTLLGVLEIAPSTMSHRCSVFLGTDLSAGEPHRDLEEQGMRSAWFSRTEVEQMMRLGEITDAKSTAALMLLHLHDTSPQG